MCSRAHGEFGSNARSWPMKGGKILCSIQFPIFTFIKCSEFIYRLFRIIHFALILSHSLSLPLVSLSSLDNDESTAPKTNGHKVKSAKCAELNKNKNVELVFYSVRERRSKREGASRDRNAEWTPRSERERKKAPNTKLVSYYKC